MKRNFTTDLSNTIKSRNTLVNVESDDYDYERLERNLVAVARTVGRNLLVWNSSQGLFPVYTVRGVDFDKTVGAGDRLIDVLSELTSIEEALSFINTSLADDSGTIYFIQDLSIYLEGEHANPLITRAILTISKTISRGKIKSILLTNSESQIKGFANIKLGLPEQSELANMIEKIFESLPIDTSNVTPQGIAKMATALTGLNENEAKLAVSRVIIDNGATISDADYTKLAMIKAEKMNQLASLELIQTSSQTAFNQVGGLENLKKWVNRRKRGFSKQAAEFGITPPKGVVVLGVSGTGKSLSAKAIASQLELPLIRFDIGSIFGSLVGQSEAQLRNTLSILETLTPAVLWIDEIDKGFSSGAEGDSGTSARVLGKLLTWLQDTKGIFTVATGNNPEKIPVELLRKGRFDETFFVDLPSESDRLDILAIHIEKTGRDSSTFNLQSLAENTAGFTGAELESLVKEALFVALDNETELSNDVLMQVSGEITPLSQTHKDSVDRLRNWAIRGNCRLANSATDTTNQPNTTRIVHGPQTNSDFEIDLN